MPTFVNGGLSGIRQSLADLPFSIFQVCPVVSYRLCIQIWAFGWLMLLEESNIFVLTATSCSCTGSVLSFYEHSARLEQQLWNVSRGLLGVLHPLAWKICPAILQLSKCHSAQWGQAFKADFFSWYTNYFIYFSKVSVFFSIIEGMLLH